MITVTFTRAELEKIYREGGFAVLPENLGLLSPELAAILADVVLDNLLGGACL